MKNIQSLHNHTTASDGSMTHRELLNCAKRYGYSAIAFADHDAMMTIETINDLRSNPVQGVRWVSAIEIASALPVELGGKVVSDFHIVGLFVDPTNIALIEHCRRTKISRVERMKQLVMNLNTAGFVVTTEECLRMSGGEVVGLPHVVSALALHPENETVMEAARRKMEQESLINPLVRARFERMMERGPSQYPYKLFLSEDAYVAGVHVPYQYVVDMDKAVRLIRDAGGVAMVAHYTTIRKYISFELLESFLAKKRIDGVEVLYGVSTSGTDETREILEDRQKLVQIVERTGCLASGGADAHKEIDLKYFAEAGDLGEPSQGLVETLAKQSGIDTRWAAL